MTNHAPELEFSFPVDVTSLPPTGRHYAIEADAAQRAQVAVRLGVQEISSLSAAFDLRPHAGGLVKVTGTARAALTQSCVVTLAPLPAVLAEAVNVTYTTAAPAKASAAKDEETDEELVAFSGEDPPEEALDGLIDLGELAVVQVALGLEPYPRAPGASFESATWGAKGEKIEAESPFAVLAQLKKKSPPPEG